MYMEFVNRIVNSVEFTKNYPIYQRNRNVDFASTQLTSSCPWKNKTGSKINIISLCFTI